MAIALDETTPLNDDRLAPNGGARRALPGATATPMNGSAGSVGSTGSVDAASSGDAVGPIPCVDPAATDALTSRLPRITQAAAQAARVLFDARLDTLVARLAGVAGWQLRPFKDSTDPTESADLPHVVEPGRIVLVHVAGSMSIDVDLRRYPALQILAGTAPSSTVNATAAHPDNAARATNAGAMQSLRQSIATALLAPLTETLLEAGAGTWRVANVQRLAQPGSEAQSMETTARRPSRSGPAIGTGHRAAADALNATDVSSDKITARVSVTFNGSHHDALVHASPAILAMLERRIASPHAGGSLQAVAYASASASASALAAGIEPEAASSSGALTGTAPHPPWRIPGRITLGARRIGIAALEALRPGDVLLRTMPAHTETALRVGNPFRARAAWGSAGLTRFSVGVEIDDGRLAITEEPIMTDEPQQPDEGMPPLAVDFQGEPIEIGDLDLPVQFELDSVALPLAQLTSLRPGYVIELDTPVVDAQIRLVAHGQTIGYGELIAVAEHLGIRIVRMAHGDGSVR